MTTYQNKGETVESRVSAAEAASWLEDNDKNSWLLFWIHKMYNEAQDNAGSRAAVKLIGNLFLYAAGRGLKKPRIAAQYKSQRYTLYLSQKGTLCLKRAIVHANGRGDSNYLCWISNGRVGWTDRMAVNDVDREFTERLFEDPVDFIAETSKDVGVCAYCNQRLSTLESMKAGYGEICADRWGLPWGDTNYPSFTEMFMKDEELRLLMGIVAENPKDEGPWLVVSDYLADRDVPWIKGTYNCLQKPNDEVILPREV